jgi:hypothetical protein
MAPYGPEQSGADDYVPATLGVVALAGVHCQVDKERRRAVNEQAEEGGKKYADEAQRGGARLGAVLQQLALAQAPAL